MYQTTNKCIKINKQRKHKRIFFVQKFEFVTNPKVTVAPASTQISLDKLQKRVLDFLNNKQPADVVIEYIKVYIKLHNKSHTDLFN